MFEVCCRLCLQQVPLQNAHSLYGKYKEFGIRDKIFELFEIQFSDTEKLSTVCNDCLEKIETVDQIRTFFLDADKQFKNFLNGTVSSIQSHEKEAQTTDAKKEQSSNEQFETHIHDHEEGFVSSNDEPNKVDESVKVEIVAYKQNQDDAEMLQIEHESDNDSAVRNDCHNDNLDGGLEVSILNIKEIAESSNQSPDDDENDYIMSQSGVIYSSDQSSNLVTLEGPAMSDIITDEETSNMKDFAEASESLSGVQEFNIVQLEYQCNVCYDIFETSVSFIQHINSFHIGEYPHQCKHCYSVYKTEEELNDHDCLAQPLIFGCTDCLERFRTEGDLQNHSQMCPESNPTLSKTPKKDNLFKCDNCNLTLSSNQQLIKHAQMFHPRDYIPHPCVHCDRLFGNAQTLRAHIASHERSYKCSFCDKLCPTAVALTGHENTHTKEQPFQCVQCGRLFAQYTSMRRHMKIHFNEKAYQCDMCPKRFRQKTVMLTHRRIHTGEKPYTCEICSKNFRDHSTLAKHKKTHEKKQRLENENERQN